MKITSGKRLASLVVGSALVLGAPFALAQNQASPSPQTPQNQAQTQVDDKTVDNFVDAYTSVREIHEDYSQRLQTAESPEKANELQQEAQKKMEEAVVASDISVEQYKRIAQQVAQDPTLRTRVQQKLRDSGEQES